jgi:hypothetical protein
VTRRVVLAFLAVAVSGCAYLAPRPGQTIRTECRATWDASGRLTEAGCTPVTQDPTP